MQYIFLLLMLTSQDSFSCDKYIIGFKGLNDMFDNHAFNLYAKKINACPISLSWNQPSEAVKLINNNDKHYQLYGYSKGAESIRYVLTKVKRKPTLIITIGAYHTAQVNYNLYGIKTLNFFDYSGKRNNAPGVHINNVSHDMIQSYVNRNYLDVK